MRSTTTLVVQQAGIWEWARIRLVTIGPLGSTLTMPITYLTTQSEEEVDIRKDHQDQLENTSDPMQAIKTQRARSSYQRYLVVVQYGPELSASVVSHGGEDAREGGSVLSFLQPTVSHALSFRTIHSLMLGLGASPAGPLIAAITPPVSSRPCSPSLPPGTTTYAKD